MTAPRMHPEDLRDLARLVAAELATQLDAPPAPVEGLVDVAAVAQHLGLSRAWVYDHASALGGVKTGAGPTAPWRFSLDEARRRLEAGIGRREAPPAPQNRGPRPKRRRPASATTGRRAGGRA